MRIHCWLVCLLVATVRATGFCEDTGQSDSPSLPDDTVVHSAALVTEAALEEVCDCPCDDCCEPWVPRWDVTVDAIVLDREAPRNLSAPGLVSQFSSGTTLLNGRDLDPSYEAGYRVGLILRKDACVSWEASFFDIDWGTNRQVTDFNNLNAVLGTVNYMLADTISIRYDSHMTNVELNRRQYLTDALSATVGVRYVSLDEAFEMTADDAGFVSNYRIGTDNDLIGLQLGAAYTRRPFCDLEFRVGVDAGIYGNAASQAVDMRDVDNTTVVRAFSHDRWNAAFLGEADVSLVWQVTQCLAARIGYQMIWVQGIARSPEQFQPLGFTPNASLNTGGGDFLNGGYAGLAWSW